MTSHYVLTCGDCPVEYDDSCAHPEGDSQDTSDYDTYNNNGVHPDCPLRKSSLLIELRYPGKPRL